MLIPSAVNQSISVKVYDFTPQTADNKAVDSNLLHSHTDAKAADAVYTILPTLKANPTTSLLSIAPYYRTLERG